MDSTVAKEIFDQLVQTVRANEDNYSGQFEFGLTRRDVILEVYAEIDAEKLVQKEVSVASDGDRDAVSGQAKRSSRVTLIGTVPYNETEKLEILLKGLALSHAAPALMAASVMKTLGDLGGKPESLSFPLPVAEQEELSKALFDSDVTLPASNDAAPSAVALATAIDTALTELATERGVSRPRRFHPEVKSAD